MTHNHEPRETDALLEHGERRHLEHLGAWGSVRHRFRKGFAEFIGTAILVMLGSGSIAQAVLATEKGSWFGITLGWGLGLTAGIYASGGVSGGHLNPAVTLAMALFRGFSWVDVPIYWVSQFAGAFAGASVVYLSYYNPLHQNGAVAPETSGIFVTGAAAGLPHWNAFVNEFVGTALLLLVILSTSDKRNTPAGNLQPLAIGLALTAIGTSFGSQTGFALNPARDLAPRLFTSFAGWGFEVFSGNSYYFWVPIAAPFLGAIGGAFIYDFFIYTGQSPVN